MTNPNVPGGVSYDDTTKRVGVWIDRARDQLCIVDRLDKRVKDGDLIPDDLIMRFPLEDSEDLIDAMFNVTVAKVLSGDDFTQTIAAVQGLLDRRAAHAIGLSELLRLEWSRQSQGTIDRNLNETRVRADHLHRLRQLRDVVAKQMQRVEEDGIPVAEAFAVLMSYFHTSRMLEA